MLPPSITRVLKRIIENLNAVDTGCKIHKNVMLKGATLGGKVIVAEGCRLFKCSVIGNVTIGRYSSLWGPDTAVFSLIHPVEIGSFCSVARNVLIQEYNHDMTRPTSYFISQNIFGEGVEQDISSKGPIRIGHDVWIGAGAVLLSGVSIGNGAVIGANAVVTKNFPPYSILGGVPAKLIGFRFQEKERHELEQSGWWNWSIEKIRKNRSFFLNPVESNKMEL